MKNIKYNIKLRQVVFWMILCFGLFIINSISAQDHCLVMNHISINPGLCDGGDAVTDPSCFGYPSDFLELYNNCNVTFDASCYTVCDGDWCARLSIGTIVSAGESIVLGSVNSLGFDTSNPNHIDIHNCGGCAWLSSDILGGYSNAGEQVVLFNSNGDLEMGLYWNGGDNIPAQPGLSDGVYPDSIVVDLNDGCITDTLIMEDPNMNPKFIDLGDVGSFDGCSIFISCLQVSDNFVNYSEITQFCFVDGSNPSIGESIECNDFTDQEVCDCENNIFTAFATAEPGTFETVGYTQLYVLADEFGNVLAINTTGEFPGLSSDTQYFIYAVNVKDEDLAAFQEFPAPIQDIIDGIGDYADYCYDFNPNAASYNCVCPTFVCPDIGTLAQFVPICEGNTFDILAFDILNTELANNGETNFDILFGYYNGTVSNPNPYTTAPDVLLNGGTAITPNGGTAGLGATLSSGTYTIVAYLSPSPADTNCQPSVSGQITINPNPIVDLGEDITACEGESIVLDAGNESSMTIWGPTGETTSAITVNASGTYQVNIENANGCTTTDEVTVTFIDAFEVDNPISICTGDSYTLPDGMSVFTPGSYSVTLTSTQGCDSVVTTILSVVVAFSIDNLVSICEGESYTLLDGTSITTEGTYPVILTSTQGCDSIITTILSVDEVLTSDNQVSICEGENYTLPDGVMISSAGTYPVTLTSTEGCDSIITTILSVDEVLTSDNPVAICEDESYTLPDGAMVSSAGTYPVTLTSIQGCDSVVNTIVTVFALVEESQSVSICEGDSYTLPDGTQVSTAGTYPVTIMADVGCDSVFTTILTITDALMEDNPVSICEGENYTLPDGTEVNTAGSYPVTLTSMQGCDSIANTILTVLPPIEESESVSICEGDSYTLVDGTQVSVTGIYPVTVMVAGGCDSIFTTTLSITDVLMEDNPVSICEGESYTLPDGSVVNTAGTYPLTLTSTEGCDSVVNTILTISPSVQVDETVTICAGESYVLADGSLVSSDGIYPVTIPTIEGCDSIINTVLSIDQSCATEVCDCENGIFTAYATAEPGTYETVDYTNVYLLTDESGSILASNYTGLFTNLSGNTPYTIYAANVKDEDLTAFEMDLSSISDVINQTGNFAMYCYELNANTASYSCSCEGFVCPLIGQIETSTTVCVGNIIDITINGISNTLQSENGETDFGILIGAYNGSITNPDPYSTAPQLVLNSGNTLTPDNGSVTLNGIGPLNNSGIFTIVAYLSPTPTGDVSCQPVAVIEVMINEAPNEPEPDNPFIACQGEPVIFSAPDGYDYLWATDAVSQEVTIFNNTSLPVTIINESGCAQTLIYEVATLF